jgi:hypothetical protein
MKVRVLKASLPTYWYADRIGEVFDVIELNDLNQPNFRFKLKGEFGDYFNKIDVEIIKEEKQMTFTKDMLKTGMRVIHGKHPRHADSYAIVVNDLDKIVFNNSGWNSISGSYKEDLGGWSASWDITEVYEAPDSGILDFSLAGKLIWQHNKPKTSEQLQLDKVMSQIEQLQQEANTLKGLIESK